MIRFKPFVRKIVIFSGVGLFFFDPDKDGQPSDQAWHYARFFFQMSFATTTSTIVSVRFCLSFMATFTLFPLQAAMAERIRLQPYIVITYLMTLVHSITAHCIQHRIISLSPISFRGLVGRWVSVRTWRCRRSRMFWCKQI